jgi:hypothetical protein
MTTWFQKLTLGAGGMLALGIGAAIVIAPVSFYAIYGISLEDDPNLLSELRAPGANLAALGGLILVGVMRPSRFRFSAVLGATVFLAYAFGRLMSMALDGMPTSGLVQATAIEFVIGVLCLAALTRGAAGTVNAPLQGPVHG